jgi:hypothetical protein
MAVGWLTLLQNVPWTDVISNAPKVADGARKLWNTLGRKPAAPSAASAAGAASGTALTAAELAARVAALEVTLGELHGQLLASSELIKTLAEQNAQFVQRIETNRRRTLWLSAATALLAVIVLGALIVRLAYPGG